MDFANFCVERICRKRKRHFTEVFDGEPQVHAGGLGAAMTEQVADGLERRAPPKQVHCEGMPQAMCPLEGNVETAPSSPRLECLGHSGRFDSAGWRTAPEEDLTQRQPRPRAAQVLTQSRTHFVGQRQKQRRASFPLGNAELAGTPVDVVEFKARDVAAPQAIGNDEKEDRVVTSTRRR